MTKEEKEEIKREYYRYLMENEGCGNSAMMLGIVLLLIILSFSSCRTIYVTQPEYHTVHDTIVKKETVEKEVIKEVTVRDSVSFRTDDSIVYIERWHWERDYRYEKALQATIDSLTQLKRDSVPYMVEVEVVKEVPARMTNWQAFLITLGKVFILIIIITVSVAFIKKRLPF